VIVLYVGVSSCIFNSHVRTFEKAPSAYCTLCVISRALLRLVIRRGRLIVCVCVCVCVCELLLGREVRVVSVRQTVGGGMTCGAEWWTASSNSGALKEEPVSNTELA